MDVEKLSELLEELSKIRGRHTELISLYLPSGYNIAKATEMISQEIALTRNVKSKTVRNNVLDALGKILQYLKQFKELPENGLVIFCGNVGEEGRSDIKLWAIEPPQPLKVKLYWCDQVFNLEPLKEISKVGKEYGILCLDSQSADFAYIAGKSLIKKRHIDSLVPGKTRAGGQSAMRFARVRENLLTSFLKKVADLAEKYFLKEEPNLKGIIVSGPGPIKEKLVREFFSDELKKKVIGIIDTSYTDEQGLKETIERGMNLLKETELARERELLKRFFEHLAKGDDLVVYGEEDTIQAMELGAVEVCLISKGHPNRKKLESICKEKNVDYEIISDDFEEGVQFKNLGGVGGILRFRID